MTVAAPDKKTTTPKKQNPAFEELYLNVREYENRMISDDELLLLPEIHPTHIHYNEWQVRKRSSERLVAYLRRKNKSLNILEIGCGNGWLSAKMAGIPGAKVIGLDINKEEVNQAKRVFKKNNLEFTAHTFNPAIFKGEKFDIILFAASITYFGDLDNVLDTALGCLTDDGEIHILDTHFYKQEDIDNAVNRMEEYYKEMGYPEMSGHYFHYSLKNIKQYKHKILVNPQSLFNRITKSEPFYWLVITH